MAKVSEKDKRKVSVSTKVKADRKADTREKEQSRRPWAPPALLYAPDPPDGFIHRWVRFEVLGHADTKNIGSRLREGFEPVRSDEYPEFDCQVIDHGRHSGIISNGGLILCRFPIKTQQERKTYFENLTEDQNDAVHQDLMSENDRAMPLDQPQNESKVLFGGGVRQ